MCVCACTLCICTYKIFVIRKSGNIVNTVVVVAVERLPKCLLSGINYI